MFLFIFVPMVAFLIGAILSRALVMGKTRTTRDALLVIGVCCAYLIVAFTMPFWAALAEIIYVIFGIAAVTLIMTGIADPETQKQTPARAGCLYAFSVFVFLPLVLFTSAMRAYQAGEIASSYDGIVTAKYRSSNHAAPSIELIADSGETTTVEGVDLPAWNAIVEKRSHVAKPAWSVFGQVDGKPFRLVPQKRVFGIGPLPD
jgi:uncharacterized membrane protein YuzA (DUF378 family)